MQILQVLKRIRPDHSLKSNISSYFQLPSSKVVPAVDSLCSLSQISTITGATIGKPKKLSTRKMEGGLRGRKESGSKGALVRKSSRATPQTGRYVSKTKGAVQGTIQGMLKGMASAGSSAEECVDVTEEAMEKFCNFSSQEGVEDEEGALEFWKPPPLAKGEGCSTSGLEGSGIEVEEDTRRPKGSGCDTSSVKGRGSSVSGSDCSKVRGNSDCNKVRGSGNSSKVGGCVGHSKVGGSGNSSKVGSGDHSKVRGSGDHSKVKGRTFMGLKDRGCSISAQESKRNNILDVTERPTLPSALGAHCDPDETPPLKRRSGRTSLKNLESVKGRKLHSDATTPTSVTANYETMVMDLSGASDVLTPDISAASDTITSPSREITVVQELSSSECLEKDSTLHNQKRRKMAAAQDSGSELRT